MKPEHINSLESTIVSAYSNIAGMVVLKDGELCYEKYFHECSNQSRIHVYSVTKSIISILIGIALDKGYIKSIDVKILDFFPEYRIKKGEKTKIRLHLINQPVQVGGFLILKV